MVRLHASDYSGHLQGGHLKRKTRTTNAVQGAPVYDAMILRY